MGCAPLLHEPPVEDDHQFTMMLRSKTSRLTYTLDISLALALSDFQLRRLLLLLPIFSLLLVLAVLPGSLSLSSLLFCVPSPATAEAMPREREPEMTKLGERQPCCRTHTLAYIHRIHSSFLFLLLHLSFVHSPARLGCLLPASIPMSFHIFIIAHSLENVHTYTYSCSYYTEGQEMLLDLR